VGAGYQTNFMVHSLGGYKFVHWLKFGIPLQVALCFLGTTFVWLFYG
jgi:di/tricarboxylate transporter